MFCSWKNLLTNSKFSIFCDVKHVSMHWHLSMLLKKISLEPYLASDTEEAGLPSQKPSSVITEATLPSQNQALTHHWDTFRNYINQYRLKLGPLVIKMLEYVSFCSILTMCCFFGVRSVLKLEAACFRLWLCTMSLNLDCLERGEFLFKIRLHIVCMLPPFFLFLMGIHWHLLILFLFDIKCLCWLIWHLVK